MFVLFLSGLRAGLRGRAIRAVVVAAVLLVGVSYLAAAFSPRQPQTVALDVGYSGLRISLVLFSLFWVEQLVAREIGSKGILLTLTYPVPRAYYVIARFASILCLLALAALLVGLMLWSIVLLGNQGYEQGFSVKLGLPFWLAVLGIWCDVVVVTAFAIWIACIATVPMLSLALGLCFAVAGKTLGAVLEYLSRGAGGDAELMRMQPLLDAIQWLLPDLSRLDWRVWPLYGVELELGTMAWPLLMAVGYVFVMMVLAVRGFSHRELS